MSFATLSQQYNQRAWKAVLKRRSGDSNEAQYARFAKRFPTLIHTCGLAQATAFALKDYKANVHDLVSVLNGDENSGEKAFANEIRTAGLVSYIALSRRALNAATWIKRASEAHLRSDEETTPSTP